MAKRIHYCSLFIISLIMAWACSPAYAQSNIEVFGENRVQRRKFDWKFFDTKHFRVYHYDKDGRALGRYVAEEAEYDITIIERKLGGQFPQRFNIILYNNYDEYRQSNIGLKDENPTMGNTKAGAVKLVDDKLVVYFTGKHTDLRHQIRSGMALVVMQRVIYGESLKKMVKNALLLNLPPWVTEGYIAYLVDGWDEKTNSEWKGILDANPKKGFYEISEQNPEIAGKAFWKFVSDQFGNNKVKNLLFAMQQKTSLNKAMKEPGGLNMNVVKAYDSCINYYKGAYIADARNEERPNSTKGLIALRVPKDGSILRNIKVSPEGNSICYVAWRNGQYKVNLQSTKGKKNTTTLVEGGKRDLTEEIDPNYPMICWSHTGSKLAILYRKGKTMLLKVYNNTRGRQEIHVIPTNRFDRVLSMAFMEDDDKLVFSAIKKSQTDLYMFTIRGTKMTNITDDVWDDISPVFVNGSSRTGILFLSNRPAPNLNVEQQVNELPAGPLNVFFYNTKSMRPELLQCTDVHKGRISQPCQYGLDNFAYLHDSNGINNKFVVLFGRNSLNQDSAYSVPVTNYTTSIINHQYNPSSGEVADVIQVGDKYMVYFHDLLMPNADNVGKTLIPTSLSKEQPEAPSPIIAAPISSSILHRSPQPVAPVAPPPVTTSQRTVQGGNAFQSEFDDNDVPTPTPPSPERTPVVDEEENTQNAMEPVADSAVLTEISDSAYLKMKPAKYRHSFKPDFLSIKLDNSVIFNQYQSIDANAGLYSNPSLGALAMLSLNELLENHRFTAGFQLPLNVSYSTYFLQYQNFTHRLDWGLFFYRKQNKTNYNVGYDFGSGPVIVQPQVFRTVTNIGQFDLSWPFDRTKSLRFHTAVRTDGYTQSVTDTLSLLFDFPNATTYTSMSRAEFVFDNTVSPTINILMGSRFKVYSEYMHGLGSTQGSCYNIGADFRNYEKLYKNFIWATRLAYGHSDGTKKVEYLVGGVDNWLRPQYSNNASQPIGSDYGFQMLATTVRGYKQYARTGNSYAVLSNELRLPVITTFVKRPIQSAILKNLQLVPFIDIGTAWHGFLPTQNNMKVTYSFPTQYVSGSLNNVQLNFYGQQGLAVGYGSGLRTSLAGYFVRMDLAWNIEQYSKPILYLALGTDF